MLALIDTIIGFAVIMLILSFLIKCLTSVVKSHSDYYSKNLKNEVMRLIDGTIDTGLNQLLKDENLKKHIEGIQWKRLGEEYLSKDNIKWLLLKLGATPRSLLDLEARIEVHKANIRYAFERRSKNIALAVGIGLCLFLNINAISIWKTLYSDQQIRSKFSSETYVKKALAEAEKEFQRIESKKQGPGENPPTKQNPEKRSSTPKIEKKQGTTEDNLNKQRADLERQREELREKIYHFRGEVSFGTGRIYTETMSWPSLFLEFLGSLLTGILVSIGAPYWHDFLRAISSLRKSKPA